MGYIVPTILCAARGCTHETSPTVGGGHKGSGSLSQGNCENYLVLVTAYHKLTNTVKAWPEEHDYKNMDPDRGPRN